MKIEYHLHDGYTKRVIIPGGAFVVAEDIAICGVKGKRYPDTGFTGTGNLRGNVLVDHTRLITGSGKLSAVAIRHS